MKPFLLSIILAACSLADAATVNFTITLGAIVPSVMGLSPGQILPGSVSYNSALVPLTGAATLTPHPLSDPTLTVDLSFAGFNYDEQDDTDPLFPQFGFMNGQIEAISYWSANKHPDSDVDGYVKIEGIPNRFIYSFDGEEEYFGTLSWPIASIPEPHTALFLGAAAFLIHRRKRPSQI